MVATYFSSKILQNGKTPQKRIFLQEKYVYEVIAENGSIYNNKAINNFIHCSITILCYRMCLLTCVYARRGMLHAVVLERQKIKKQKLSLKQSPGNNR